MAECIDNVTFVHEPTVQESVKENYVQEMRQDLPDKKTNDTVSQTSDDEYAESVVTIGEIGIDEYFDDVFCNNNLSVPVIHDTPSNCEPSTSGTSISNVTNVTPNEPINVLQLAVDSVHPDIVIKEERRITLEEHQFNEAMEAAANINHYLRSGKRVREIQGPNGMKRLHYSGLKLSDIGVTALPRFLWINNIDENIMATNRLLLRLPAQNSVSNILKSFTVKKNMDSNTLEIMLLIFNAILPCWCLRQIERLQFENLKEKYPDKQLCDIYGLVHFIRFSTYLPYFIRAIGPFARNYSASIVNFMNSFMDFLEEANITLDTDDFYHVMPDYHRMTFKSGPSKYLYKVEKYEDDEDDEDEYY